MLTQIKSPVRRENAAHFLHLMLLSFAVSVILTRLYLELTGYPQIGSNVLHIAHALWGGLLLFIACLLPLVIANRWVYTWSALAGGVGVGLFIDEVGKFITRSNDYFFPFAAPIIYAFFLLAVLVYVQVRRPVPKDYRAELYAALDGLLDLLDRDLDPRERAHIERRLHFVAAHADYPEVEALAHTLLEFLASDSLKHIRPKPSDWTRLTHRAQPIRAWLTQRTRLKWALVAGLGALGLFALTDLSLSLLALVSPRQLEQLTLDLLMSQERIRGAVSASWYIVRLVLEGGVGAVLLVAAILLALGRERVGAWLGYIGLILALTTINMLVLYFDQFTALLSTTLQFGLLLGLTAYRSTYVSQPEIDLRRFLGKPVD